MISNNKRWLKRRRDPGDYLDPRPEFWLALFLVLWLWSWQPTF